MISSRLYRTNLKGYEFEVYNNETNEYVGIFKDAGKLLDELGGLDKNKDKLVRILDQVIADGGALQTYNTALYIRRVIRTRPKWNEKKRKFDKYKPIDSSRIYSVTILAGNYVEDLK